MKRICTFNYLAIHVLGIKVILDIIINYVVLKNICAKRLYFLSTIRKLAKLYVEQYVFAITVKQQLLVRMQGVACQRAI